MGRIRRYGDNGCSYRAGYLPEIDIVDRKRENARYGELEKYLQEQAKPVTLFAGKLQEAAKKQLADAPEKKGKKKKNNKRQ